MKITTQVIKIKIKKRKEKKKEKLPLKVQRAEAPKSKNHLKYLRKQLIKSWVVQFLIFDMFDFTARNFTGALCDPDNLPVTKFSAKNSLYEIIDKEIITS